MNDQNALFQRSGFDVSVTDLHKSYLSGERTFSALRGLICAIPSGQVTVIQGPSGCGKTTLMNIVGGVDSADRGIVMIGPNDLTANRDERSLAEYRLNGVGFVFQAFNLIPGLTVIDNLRLPIVVSGGKSREQQDERSESLLALVGMGQNARKRPDDLSGGEQQRVAIALALVNDPPLILADEPTGNLDSANSDVVTELLCSLAHQFGKTVVIATHDARVGARGDQNLQMRDGAFEQTALVDAP